MAEELKEGTATRISALRRQLIEALVRLEDIEKILRQEIGDGFFEENSELLRKLYEKGKEANDEGQPT